MKWKRLFAATLGAATLVGVLTPTAVRADGVQEGEWFQTQVVLDDYDGPATVWAQALGGRGIYEGDIDLGSVAELTGAQPQSGTRGADSKLWRNGKIPYQLSNLNATETQVWNDSVAKMNGWVRNVQWVPRSNNEVPFVSIVSDERPAGCGTSLIGKDPLFNNNTYQNLWIDKQCWNEKTVLHEMLHAMGAYHEQSRSDRNAFVQINWDNIKDESKHNFCTPNQTDCPGRQPADIEAPTVNYGLYDYKSIMHYRSNAFSKNGSATMTALNGNTIAPADEPTALDIAGIDARYSALQYTQPVRQRKDFGSKSAKPYTRAKYVRTVVDLNGDGPADLLIFDDNGVTFSLNNGTGGFPALKTYSGFGYNQGWTPANSVRLTGNVSGTKTPADSTPLNEIVGFGADGVYVANNLGNGNFEAPKLATTQFTYSSGWRIEKHERVLADVNGDGWDDIVGFGEGGTHTALSNGDGTFKPAVSAIAQFGYSQSWRVGKHVRMLVDYDDDGKLDIVGFGEVGVYVAKGNGNGTFQARVLVLNNYGGANNYGIDHPRFVADLQGNGGRPEVIAFGAAGVYVSLQKADGKLDVPLLRAKDFGYDQGWRAGLHDRFIVDIDGDGLKDIVGFGNYGLQGALQAPQPGIVFFKPRLLLPFFGYHSGFGYRAGTGGVDAPRFLVPLNAGASLDPIAYGSNGIYDTGTGGRRSNDILSCCANN